MNENKKWNAKFPNSADWTFNYYKLVELSSIGNFKVSPKIAIIGAGISGILTARELIKAGCKTIHIYEATERIGGRTYSIKAKGQSTTFEMGAMRIPFFTKPENNNCVLASVIQNYNIEYKDFPAPGSENCMTGVYLRGGRFENRYSKEIEKPKIFTWKKGDENPDLPEEIKIINEKWGHFSSTFQEIIKDMYETKEWKPFWEKIVKMYHDKDFRQIVLSKKDYTFQYQNLKKKEKEAGLNDNEKKKLKSLFSFFKKGDFGGLNMSNDIATLFFSIGAGDGGWGAFYDISSLYVIRTLLCGYGENHKLIIGVKDKDLMSHLPNELFDSNENKLSKPNFLGVQSFAEALFYLKDKHLGYSVYDCIGKDDFDVRLYTSEPVEIIDKRHDDFERKGKVKIHSKNFINYYDDVVLTIPTWATQINMSLKFDRPQLPLRVRQSLKFSHWITSAKLFFALKDSFWKDENFPKAILTDTFIQDVYFYSADDKNDPGVLLASYTWEDNSMKMLGFENEEQLVQSCINQLNSIFQRCNFIDPKTKKILNIKNYINTDSPIRIHWSKKPFYFGCSKLYRQNNEIENFQLLNNNRLYSKNSHLYFAGEAYSVEGGWIEPGIRLALDAVIHIIKNNDNAGFNKEFDYEAYEKLTNTDYLENLINLE